MDTPGQLTDPCHSSEAPIVSVVLPVFNGASYLPGTLRDLESLNRVLQAPCEIIFVNDGSSDQTATILSSQSDIKVITHQKNEGKYQSLKSGVLSSRGRFVLCYDADLPFDLDALVYAYSLLRSEAFHVVLADRHLPESSTTSSVSPLRRAISWIFANLVRLLLTGEVYDTQCGLKGYRGDVARELFSLVRDRKFAGDVEIVYLALKLNLALRRFPVRQRSSAPSTISLLGVALSMSARVLSIPFAWKLGLYKPSSTLRAIASQRYWGDKPFQESAATKL